MVCLDFQNDRDGPFFKFVSWYGPDNVESLAPECFFYLQYWRCSMQRLCKGWFALHFDSFLTVLKPTCFLRHRNVRWEHDVCFSLPLDLPVNVRYMTAFLYIGGYQALSRYNKFSIGFVYCKFWEDKLTIQMATKICAFCFLLTCGYCRTSFCQRNQQAFRSLCSFDIP